MSCTTIFFGWKIQFMGWKRTVSGVEKNSSGVEAIGVFSEFKKRNSPFPSHLTYTCRMEKGSLWNGKKKVVEKKSVNYRMEKTSF